MRGVGFGWVDGVISEDTAIWIGNILRECLGADEESNVEAVNASLDSIDGQLEGIRVHLARIADALEKR